MKREHNHMLPTLNIFVKFLNVGLIHLAVIYPDLPQFHGKAMGARLIFYPLAALIVPILWWLISRKSKYPHLIDILVLIPFILDSGGNAFNLYNTTEGFDRFAHWFCWVSLTIAFGSAVSRPKITKINVFGLSLGFGAITHLLWEVAEFIVMRMGASGLQLTYEDTLDDLILSFAGSLVASILVITIFWKAKLMPKKTQDVYLL